MPDVREVQLQAALKRAVNDARTLAFVFILLGLAGFFIAWQAMDHWEGRLLAAACGIVLLAPGVLYYIAAHQLAKKHPSGARLGRWAAWSHIAIVPVLIGVYSVFSKNEFVGLLLVPVVVSVFFVPALIAFLFSMTKAIRIARAMEETGHGFQVLPPQAVLPVDEATLTDERI